MFVLRIHIFFFYGIICYGYTLFPLFSENWRSKLYPKDWKATYTVSGKFFLQDYSYAGYKNAFQIEAQALAVWASECWVAAGQIEADVQSGARDMPTANEVLAELPKYI